MFFSQTNDDLFSLDDATAPSPIIYGMSTGARQTGMAQFFINIFGALLFFPFLEQFGHLVSYTATETPRLIANAHTIFNITVSLCLMPFVGVLIIILKKIVPTAVAQRAVFLFLKGYNPQTL